MSFLKTHSLLANHQFRILFRTSVSSFISTQMNDENISIIIRANSSVVTINLLAGVYNLTPTKRKLCRDAGSWIKTAAF